MYWSRRRSSPAASHHVIKTSTNTQLFHHHSARSQILQPINSCNTWRHNLSLLAIFFFSASTSWLLSSETAPSFFSIPLTVMTDLSPSTSSGHAFCSASALLLLLLLSGSLLDSIPPRSCSGPAPTALIAAPCPALVSGSQLPGQTPAP